MTPSKPEGDIWRTRFSKSDAVIRMRCAKKPLPQKGAYLAVRDRIAERGFDKAGRRMTPSVA